MHKKIFFGKILFIVYHLCKKKDFIKCFSKVKFLSVGFFQPKNIIKNPNTKIKYLKLLYFVFYISVVFFKSLF